MTPAPGHVFLAGDPVVVHAHDVQPFAGRVSAVGGGMAHVSVGFAVLRFGCVDLRHARPCGGCRPAVPRPRVAPEAALGLPGGG